MEAIENPQYVFLGIKVKPGPMERHKVENFTLDNTVDRLKSEAEKKTSLPSALLELIHHGKILKDNVTLSDSGVKSGEMVHVVKKKDQAPPATLPTFTEGELLSLISSLRTLGCTPNSAGWTRAMQLLSEESVLAEVIDHSPSIVEDCSAMSILHEVELLAALGANTQTMRRGAEAHPSLPNALRHLIRLVRTNVNSATTDTAPPPTSGFAYSLEALSDDEDVEEEETEESDNRNPITQEQLAAALQAATEAALSSTSRTTPPVGLLRLLQAVTTTTTGGTTSATPAARGTITAEMCSEAISEALTRAAPVANAPTQSAASSSVNPEDFTTQLQRMHEMGLLNDVLNIRALLITGGDANAAINLVISGTNSED